MSKQPHLKRARKGRPYERARELMFAKYGRNCWVCGHPGAGEAGHVKALAKLAPGQVAAPDPDAMRPMHGSNYPCAQCGGRHCNQEQGTRHLSEMFTPRLVL